MTLLRQEGGKELEDVTQKKEVSYILNKRLSFKAAFILKQKGKALNLDIRKTTSALSEVPSNTCFEESKNKYDKIKPSIHIKLF